jgi:hypothetical protein
MGPNTQYLALIKGEPTTPFRFNCTLFGDSVESSHAATTTYEHAVHVSQSPKGMLQLHYRLDMENVAQEDHKR